MYRSISDSFIVKEFDMYIDDVVNPYSSAKL